MRVSTIVPFLCGAATLVKGSILSISVPQTIKLGGSFNVTIDNDDDQSSNAQVTLAIGLDPSSSLPNDDLGIFIGGINLLDIPLGVSNHTVPSWPPYNLSGKMSLKIAILDIVGELGAIGTEVWNTSVSIGAATSKTYVDATWVVTQFI